MYAHLITAEEAASMVAKKEAGINQNEINRFLKKISNKIKKQAKIGGVELSVWYDGFTFNKKEEDRIFNVFKKLGYECKIISAVLPFYEEGVLIKWDRSGNTC